MNGSDVKTVLVDGKFVMRNRQLQSDEMEEPSKAGAPPNRLLKANAALIQAEKLDKNSGFEFNRDIPSCTSS
jgi:hypothetical protein